MSTSTILARWTGARHQLAVEIWGRLGSPDKNARESIVKCEDETLGEKSGNRSQTRTRQPHLGCFRTNAEKGRGFAEHASHWPLFFRGKFKWKAYLTLSHS
jgi:hypothetical protein